jgi:hypothetical protein
MFGCPPQPARKEVLMVNETQMSIGEFISNLFEEYLQVYEDEQMATIATAATVNEMICEMDTPPNAIEETEQAA